VCAATLPHVIEPKYPGVVEKTVLMSDCWNDAVLNENREEIINLYSQISSCHENCCRYLAAAAALQSDTYRLCFELTDVKKLTRFAARLAQQELKHKRDDEPSEKIRFISAVTNEGITVFENTARSLAKNIYVIEDEYGCVSRLLLSCLRAFALDSGLNIITCYCPLSPSNKIEHLFIPELNLGFMTSNRYHKLTLVPYKVISSRRFTNKEKLKGVKRRIAFNRKATAQMLEQACVLLKEAKQKHDALETYYKKAMDFTKAEQKTAELVAKIKAEL